MVNQKKKLGRIVALTICLMCIVTFSQVSALRVNSTSPNTELSLLEVKDRVLDYLKDESSLSFLSIQSLTSITDSIESGVDGRRSLWEVSLIDKSTSTVQVFRIRQNQLVKEITYPSLEDNPCPLEIFTMDSVSAFSQIREIDPELTGMNSEEKGFLFAVSCSNSKTPILTVSAFKNLVPAQIKFNANTGQLISKEIQTLIAGKIYYSRDRGKTWSPAIHTGSIRAISKDQSLVDHAFALVIEGTTYSILETIDGGQNWHEGFVLPPSIKGIIFSLEYQVISGKGTFVVGSTTGAWQSVDGKNWTYLESLPSGPAQWINSICDEENNCSWFVSISDGNDKGLYVTKDLESWERVSETPYRLFSDYKNEKLIAFDESSNGAYMFDSLRTMEKVMVPVGTLRMTGSFERDHLSIVTNSVYLSDSKLTPMSWDGKQIYFTCLAASPNFKVDGLVIGLTDQLNVLTIDSSTPKWQELSNWREDTKPQTKCFEMQFLSLESVIIATGGRLTWVEY